MTDTRATRDALLAVTTEDDGQEIRVTRDDALAVTSEADGLEVRVTRDALLVIANTVLSPPDATGTGPAGGFTAAFDHIIDTGFGIFEYRLMIEGWPEEFVTVSWITHADNKAGRDVYTGLTIKGSGARNTSRIIMQEARIQADGLAFRIRGADGFDRALQSLSHYPTPIAQLDATLEADGAVMTTVPAAALVAGNVYHLGTEAVLAGDANAITRHVWDTLRQSHAVSDTNRARATYVYERPPTMQGRRAYLFAYGERDSGAGDGSLVWRGFVNRPPRRDRDGKTWVIDCDPITKILMQNVAGSIAEAHPVGIYHHKQCAFAFVIAYDGTVDEVQRYTAWDPTEETFIANVNTMLEARRLALGISQIDVGGLVLAKSPNEGVLTINVTPNDDMPDFSIGIGSPIVGVVGTPITGWTDSKTGRVRPGVGLVGIAGFDASIQLRADQPYYAELTRGNTQAADMRFLGYEDGFTYDGAPVAPLGYAAYLMSLSFHVKNLSFFVDPTSTLPTHRIYVDTDLSGATTVAISDTYGSGLFPVTGSGVNAGCNYIEIHLSVNATPPKGSGPEQHAKDLLVQAGFNGFLTGNSTIVSVRNYLTTLPSQSGSVVDFVAGLKLAAVDANLGDSPQVTDADLTTWAFDDAVPSVEQLSRSYVFVKKHTLEEVLAEECKFVTHFPRLELDGRIGFLPLPTYAEADDVDDGHDIDRDGIVTPGGEHGSWPGWDPQRDGIASTVEINDSYDFRSDDWTNKPFIFYDPDVIATHKGRGATVLSIKPYSLPTTGPSIDPGLFRAIADAYLGVFGLDYTVVTLEVTIRHYRVLCGDIVRLTHERIPAADGTEGMTDRLGVVIGVSKPIDVSRPTIDLDVLVYLEPVFGYAPTALITAHADNGGDSWDLTCDPADAYNIEWSSNEDGRVLGRFADGFKIRIVRMDSTTEVSVSGTVVGTPDAAAGTMTVQLDAAFAPSFYQWRVEFSNNADLTAEQEKYAIVADTTLQIFDGDFARRLG